MYFYEILQTIMDEKNLKIPDVARLTGLTDSTIRSIISRKNKTVALEVAFKISKGLAIPIERLNGENIYQSPLENDKVQTLGSIVKEYRQSNGLSMDEFAKLCGLSKGYISMLENNINPRNNKPIAPTLPTLQKIAAGMNIEVNNILKLLNIDKEIFFDDAIVNKVEDVKSMFDDSYINKSKESTLGEKIKTARKNKNITQKQLADKIGVVHNSISDWENNKNKPDLDTISLLCGVLGITPNYLLSVTSEEISPSEKKFMEKYRDLDPFGKETVDITLDRETSRVQHIKNAMKSRSATLRIYTYMHNIACAGNGFYFDDIPTDTIEAPYMEGADFIIGVSGDSMEPTFYDGDKVYVEQRQVLEIGDIGIYIINNECKIKETGKDGLISHNDKYEIIPGDENIHCIGKVLGKVPEDIEEEIDNTFELYQANASLKKAVAAEHMKKAGSNLPKRIK